MAVFVQLPGETGYTEAHSLQKTLLAARIADRIPDVVLLLEHAETITVGRARDAMENVLVPDGVPVVPVERGGDVTWHGPGQLVAYPILKLGGRRADLHLHLHSLEDGVIALLRDWGLEAGQDARNTGVWLPEPAGPAKKVCSIGIACRKWVTWHGLALNLTVDLTRFRQINPCGFDADVMTRVADHLDPCPSVSETAAALVDPLAAALEVEVEDTTTLDPTEVLRHLAERSRDG